MNTLAVNGFMSITSHKNLLSIKEMVAAVVVVSIPVSPVAFVPDALDLGEGGRLFAVHGRYQVLVHPLAVLAFTLNEHLLSR